jgi:hypothetical protein
MTINTTIGNYMIIIMKTQLVVMLNIIEFFLPTIINK